MAVIHAGWGMVMGRVFCGRRSQSVRIDLEEMKVTCKRCLDVMCADAAREVYRLENALEKAKDHRHEMHQLRWGPR